MLLLPSAQLGQSGGAGEWPLVTGTEAEVAAEAVPGNGRDSRGLDRAGISLLVLTSLCRLDTVRHV